MTTIIVSEAASLESVTIERRGKKELKRRREGNGVGECGRKDAETETMMEKEEEKESERIAGWMASVRARKSERPALFIVAATNTEQLVSIRPVIVSFTQPLCVVPLAKWSRE